MTQKVDEIKRLLQTLGEEEIREVAVLIRSRTPPHMLEAKWNTQWEVILDAIARSGDISQRGIRGLIAESTFESRVIPTLSGWEQARLLGELSYDFKIRSIDSGAEVTIQVKLQRMVNGIPLVASASRKCYPDDHFIVEVQKTRNGADGEKKTRPYRFGEFDILAVSMHPSTGSWSDFMYTVGSWLLPRTNPGDEALIRVLQPVSKNPNEFWTDSLPVCIDWLFRDERKVIFDLASADAAYKKLKKDLILNRLAERKALSDTLKAERKALRANKRSESQP